MSLCPPPLQGFILFVTSGGERCCRVDRPDRRPGAAVWRRWWLLLRPQRRLGHSTGDRVLRAVTESIQRQIRPSDTLGRLGGDEFGLLLPETQEEDAKKVIDRIHTSLVNEMLKNNWTITFSMGVVTYCQAPQSVDDMVKLADNAMYQVKNNGKNGVSYQTYDG